LINALLVPVFLAEEFPAVSQHTPADGGSLNKCIAGGYDAIFLLVIDAPEVVAVMEDVWEGWTEMSVCPLKARQSDGGIRLESLDEISGLSAVLKGM
jgi:phosphomevalonate kinase